MLNGNKSQGQFLLSEAGTVQARRKNPSGILPQHNLRKRGGDFALIIDSAKFCRGRDSRLRFPAKRGKSAHMFLRMRKRVVTR